MKESLSNKKLHSRLLALSRTCTLVLALRIVEVIAEGHAELATRIRYNFHGTDTAIGNGPKCILFQQVVGKELYIEAVLEEALLYGHVQNDDVLWIFQILQISLGAERTLHVQ